MLSKFVILLTVGLATANLGIIASSFPEGSYENSVEQEEEAIPAGKEPCESRIDRKNPKLTSKDNQRAAVHDSVRKGTYYNSLSGECEFCSECKDFMYIRKECTATTNTQCGWCGSRTIVKSNDFEKKCKTFSMYQEFRKKLIRLRFMEKHAPLTDLDMKESKEDVENGKIVINIDRPDLDEEDRVDFSLADEEDFMRKRVIDMKTSKQLHSMELTSEEIDQEIEAKEVNEQDIGEEEVTEETEYSDSDELPPLPEDDLPDEEERVEELSADKAAQTEDEDDIELHKELTKKWKSRLSETLARELARTMIKEQVKEGKYETVEDDEDGSIIEVKPPKESESSEEQILRRAEEIEFIPLKIVVTPNEVTTKTPHDVATKKTEDSEEEKGDSSEEDETDLALALQQEARIQSNRRMVRIAVMSISFVIMCWIFISYREKRRKRIFIIPPLDSFTLEQEHMINRCNCKQDAQGHCYENQLAYV